MKKIRKIQVIALCFAILLGTFSVPMRAEAAFNKKEIKKKITVTYKKLPYGILVMYSNKNKTNVSLTATMKFLDSDNQVLSKDTQKNLCLKGKSKAAFFFVAPRDEYGHVVNYTNYKGRLSVAKTSYKPSNSSINISSKLDAVEGSFVAVNSGKKTLTNIHATIVLYDENGFTLGCYTKYLNCFKPNDIDQFKISYAAESFQPNKAKVYIDWAY